MTKRRKSARRIPQRSLQEIKDKLLVEAVEHARIRLVNAIKEAQDNGLDIRCEVDSHAGDGKPTIAYRIIT